MGAVCSFVLGEKERCVAVKFVMYQDCLSPHQLPLARELLKRLGADDFRYVYRDADLGGRACLGWKDAAQEHWMVHQGLRRRETEELVEHADVVLTMFRDVDLIERRCRRGLTTFYTSERWFKPLKVAGKGWNMGRGFPGWIRLFVPKYWRMARRFVRLMDDPNFYLLPYGVHAARDFVRLYHLVHGHLIAAFLARPVKIDRALGGCVEGFPRLYLWAYFVASSEDGDSCRTLPSSSSPLRVLWVGRMLDWKCVDSIVRALHNLVSFGRSPRSCHLTLVGSGPEESRLKSLVERCQLEDVVSFQPPAAIDEVRQLMRDHDVYVLSSNEYEGWGAVVSEALSEGMRVLGTHEAGSCATILPDSCLFHVGDVKRLANLLSMNVPQVGIGPWTAQNAAKWLVEILYNTPKQIRVKD